MHNLEQTAVEGDTSVIANSAPTTVAVTCASTTTTTTTTSVIPTSTSAAESDINNGDSCKSNMTPDIAQDQSTFYGNDVYGFVVKDMSTISLSHAKKMIVHQKNSSVGSVISAVSKHFLYEPNSFALTYQKSTGEMIELHELHSDKCLREIGFVDFGSENNKLYITNFAANTPPRKVEEDDLSLGASASPTSSVTEIRPSTKWYDAPPVAVNYETFSDSGGGGNSSRIKQDTIGYVGLVNQAMTCYLNSLLQTLFMTPEFRNALYRWEFKGSEEAAAKSIPYQLQKLFLLLQTASRSAVETTNLTKSFGWDSSEVWQQHDIQELYRVMFDALEQCFKNTDQSELINNLYEGKMKDYVKCLECGTENAREDSFLDIPLPIRPFGSNTAYKSVEEALRAFVEPELLSGNNQYECSKCKSLCDAHKGLKFTRFPYLLTLHLKRFDFDYQTFHRIKLNDKVTFPNILDLNGFMEDTVKETVGGQDQNSVSVSPGQTNSPDKCLAEKLDDASTTDSGSALDAEESSSVGFSTSNQASNDTDTQDEDEGIDVSSVYNEKNRLLCMSNGPYVYELFSIMVHSGSASGGHYYAYIKDLKTGEWFCFNDQSVSRITYDDIRKTYGGANSRGYYSSWSSSANAYMLMYRQADKERNVDIFTEEDFPPHIKELVQKMVTEEAAEREAREIERLMCKIKLFCPHPKLKVLLEKKFKVHKDTTLKEATKLAYQELKLEDVVPLERCRLVKYEEVHDSIECSFNNQDDEPISEVLGGVRSSYKFDLLMEIRDEDKEFEEYKPGGITIKVHTVNLETEEVDGPHIVRASQTQTVKEFKELLGRSLSLDPIKMRVVKEKYYNDHKPLTSDTKLLKDEGFYRSNKVFVEASGIEPTDFFAGSQLYSVLDRYENTITIHCYLPNRSPEVLEELQIPPYNPKEHHQRESQEEVLTPSKPEASPEKPEKNKSETEASNTEANSLSTTTTAATTKATTTSRAAATKTAKETTTATKAVKASSITTAKAKATTKATEPSNETVGVEESKVQTSESEPAKTVSTTTLVKAVTPVNTATTTTTTSKSIVASETTTTTTTTTTSTAVKAEASSTTGSATKKRVVRRCVIVKRPSTDPNTNSVLSAEAASPSSVVSKPAETAPPSPVAKPSETAPPSSLIAKPSETAAPPSLVAKPSETAAPPSLVVKPLEAAAPPSLVAKPSEIAATQSLVTKPKKEIKNIVKKKADKLSVLSTKNTNSETLSSVVVSSSTDTKVLSSTASITSTSKSSTTTETHNTTHHLRDASISSVSSTTVNLSDEDEAALPDGEVAVGSSSSTVNSDQSASEDSSLTSDSDRTLVGEQTEGNLFDLVPDYHNVSSPDDDPKVDVILFNWNAPSETAPDTGWDDDDVTQSVKRYFRAYLTEPRILRVSVDKRITIGQLKNELQKYVGVSEEHFKLYKYYMNSSHEFECTRMTETLYSYGDNNVMKIRLGRALLPDEFKGKVFLLDPSNSDDPAKFLIDFVVRKKESVMKVKNAIVKEVNSKCSMELDPAKIRLRKKSWKNPQTIFLDHQIFDDDIMLYANWEYYLQILDGPEEKTDKPDELSVFLKRFRPSSYSTDSLTEVILSTPTAEALSAKISEISGIPVENVEFAKGKGTFPCDMSNYEIPTDLDWSRKTGLLDKRPIYILDDGAVVYYRDCKEPLKSLTESEKNDLINDENVRLNRDYHSASAVVSSSSVSTSSRSREKGLKIYLSQSSGGK